MGRRLPAVATAFMVMVFALTGCGGGDRGVSTVVTEIFSDPGVDGDIAFDPTPPGTFTVSSVQTTKSVLAGIAPGSAVEYRGFLDFPLGGSGGVPSNASIVSATLEVFVRGVNANPGATVPIVIDLVSFPPPLQASDYSRQSTVAILSRTVDFFGSDQGNFVPIDVTSLMREAQRLNLPEFQVRLLLDLSASSGRIEIDDQPTVGSTAPLLTVEYL
jgi:hypothetical protein